MQDQAFNLSRKAFGDDADKTLVVAYQSHQDALHFLAESLAHANAVALLQGPAGSGKSTIAAEQADWSAQNAPVARIDGDHLTPRQLLAGMLSQFGIESSSLPDERLLQTLSSYLGEQTREGHTPVLIIDDVDRASPSALRLLNWVAAQESRNDYALRIVLTGRSDLSMFVKDDTLRDVARRHPPSYSLNPMTLQESSIYLRTRLIAAGGQGSATVFSIKECEKLHKLSRGWPGSINRLAYDLMNISVERLVSSEDSPIPSVVITRDGETVATVPLTEKQYIIGRSSMSDIVIDDSYVSKVHAMLHVYSNAIVMLDLNSTNGTTVNSVMVERTVLRSDDIITLGHYRLKILNAPPMDTKLDERIKATDTLTMQNLEDYRRSRARRTVKALKNR